MFLMLWQLPASSQGGSTISGRKIISDRIAEQLHSLSKGIASDLVYLQTSKSIYGTQEDVWFKGYVLDAQFFLPSGKSKILFVQLIEDKTDKVVWEKKYEIENGFVNGHLFLDSELAEGTYTLAAYSSFSYTLNAKEFYAVKKFKVIKTLGHKVIVNQVLKDSTIQFATYPEGGNLVSGIQSVLAFKAVDSNGLPVNVSGTLYENNSPLIDFKSRHAGMGSFVFTPDANKQYHIQLTAPASNKLFTLAKIYQSGKALQLIGQTKEALTFKVSQSAALSEGNVYIRLQVRGVVYSVAIGLLKKELIVTLPLKNIPQGIAEVTLFNGDLVPEAERLVYVNPEQKLYIKTELNKDSYGTREKATLKISVTDQDGQPAVAHLGLSIYDKLYQNKQDSKNILTHYLLSTQLKGTIYDPVYYFNDMNKDRQQALNLLLLTQGWRSYVWEESNLRAQGNTLRPIVFDELKAKIRVKNSDTKIKEPLPQGVIISSADEHKGTNLLLADATGVFPVTPNDLKKGEGGSVYLKLMAPHDSQYRINVKDFSFEEINKERKRRTTFYPIPAVSESKTKVSSAFANRTDINQLKEVVITSKKNIVFRDKFIGKLDSLARADMGTIDYVCTLTNILNDPMCICHPSVLKKKPVEGESYRIYEGFKWLAGDCSHYSITGQYDSRYHYRDLTESELLEMFNIAVVTGYYGKKVFYEPIYDEVTINDPLPDYRNTLYWKPDLITNELGEATVSFFCSDINTVFLGSIEGVSGDGLLGAANFEFTVKK
jgi:hypothetical protein